MSQDEKSDVVAVSSSEEETDRSLMKGGKSIITDKKDESRRLAIVTFAVMSGAATYIMMLFLAMPVSIHLIVNQRNNCNPEVNTACFSPTAESQTQLTLTLTLLRLMTFLMGSFVGTVSDVYGRRPMLILALLGYATTAICFLIGWSSQSLEMFLIGAIILGASSPITPHGVAYVSDMSRPEKLAGNLGVLQGIGYFCGLMLGAIIGLGISIATLGEEEETGSAGIEAYDNLFYFSYGAGLLLSGTSAILMILFLPESLHKEERVASIDIKKANPIGFIYMVSRQPYIFMIWIGAFFAWMAVGAGESVNGGWWLRRYVKTELTDFILFVVVLWTVSGMGSVMMTKAYVMTVGVKGGLHVSAVATFIVGLAFAFSPTARSSYSAVAVSFFASPIYAIILAVLMGQVGALEKGALAGALRSSEALGKLIGIVAFGNAFASYIENFRPDQSCVPANYDPNTNPGNSCDCGVETCPDLERILGGNNPAVSGVSNWRPSNCTLGQLSATFHGKVRAGYSLEESAENQNLRPLPPAAIPLLLGERPDECLGSGLVNGLGGFETTVNAFWCVNAAPSQFGLPNNAPNYTFPLPPVVNENDGVEAARRIGTAGSGQSLLGLGCDGFNLGLFGLYGYYGALFQGGSAAHGPATLGVAAILANSSKTIEEMQEIISLVPALNDAGNVDEQKEFEELCPANELNLCMTGPLTDFPGLFPFLYLFVLGLVSYIFILIGEFVFIQHDKKYWKSVEEEGLGETHVVGEDVASPKE